MKTNTEKVKQERGVVHLVIKATGANYFYGNMKALFDNQEQEENDGTLGVSYNYMKNYDFSEGKTYENDKCVIRKGVICTVTKKEWMRDNMAEFQLGAKVINVQSRDKGRIVEVYPTRRGSQLYEVIYSNGNATTEREDCLVFDIDISDPFERCKGGFFDSYNDYALINAIFKIENSNKSTISSLKAPKTLFKAYQFIPLLKFINSDNNKLLVADEVGLGKTIEAGHIMLELKARKQLRNVLIEK